MCCSDQDPLSEDCLELFQGDFVIHVGELFGSSLSQSHLPFGRTSSPGFQERLVSEFHCVLSHPLTRRWSHSSRDCLTVWKRTIFKPVNWALIPDEEDEEDTPKDGNKKEVQDSDDEEHWAIIPKEEIFPQSLACQKYQFLIGDPQPIEIEKEQICQKNKKKRKR